MEFKKVSIILPTLKETESFVKVVSMILKMNRPEDIEEFIAVVCDRTRPESLQSIEKGKKIAQAAGVPFTVFWQKLPHFGGAIRESFMIAKGSHVCMVTPDLDTAPDKLPEMIALAKQYPADVIVGSRWRKGGGFVRYGRVKKVWNWLSQKFMNVLYLTTALTDFTWGNHLAPTKLYQSINFQELKHPINIEKVVIPLRLGIGFHEVPAVCEMPEDDETVNSFMANLAYLRPAFRWRFAKLESMMKPGIDYRELLRDLKATPEQENYNAIEGQSHAG